MDNLPILSLTAYAPLLGALIIFAFRRIEREQARVVALIATLASFIFSLNMLLRFEKNDQFQFTETVK